MKKIISILLLISLLLVATTCFAENNTKLYEDKMKGTWKLNDMSILANGNLFNGSSFATMTFPRRFCYVSGDETGKVYIVMNGGFTYLRAEVTFTSDYKTMILIDKDGSFIILDKE